MIPLKSQVGKWKLIWKSVPQGKEGKVQVEVSPGEIVEVSWKKDDHGIWLVLPQGIFGFDLHTVMDDDGSPSFSVVQRGFHKEWTSVKAELGEPVAGLNSKGGKAKATRVRAQMPGKIVRILTQAGNKVEKGQSLLVMEAMKMENEIKAPSSGTIKEVKVTEAQAVETGADLVLIDPV